MNLSLISVLVLCLPVLALAGINHTGLGSLSISTVNGQTQVKIDGKPLSTDEWQNSGYIHQRASKEQAEWRQRQQQKVTERQQKDQQKQMKTMQKKQEKKARSHEKEAEKHQKAQDKLARQTQKQQGKRQKSLQKQNQN